MMRSIKSRTFSRTYNNFGEAYYENGYLIASGLNVPLRDYCNQAFIYINQNMRAADGNGSGKWPTLWEHLKDENNKAFPEFQGQERSMSMQSGY